MEKYAKLMKGLEMCAGPDCCGEHCPYYGETRGGKTCRAWLLNDAAAAIANEEAGSETLAELLHNTEAERDKLAGDNAELREKCEALEKKVAYLTADRDALRALRCPPKEKTDQPSVCDKALAEEVGKLIAQAKYQEGRADTLAEIVARCSFGGGCRHE